MTLDQSIKDSADTTTNGQGIATDAEIETVVERLKNADRWNLPSVAEANTIQRILNRLAQAEAERDALKVEKIDLLEERNDFAALAEDRKKELAALKSQQDGLRCSDCGGPHPYDTSIPSPAWNRVVRGSGLSDTLCPTCIIKAFVKAGESFTATLWADDLGGVPIEVIINSQAAKQTDEIVQHYCDKQAALIEENHALRAEVKEGRK